MGINMIYYTTLTVMCCFGICFSNRCDIAITVDNWFRAYVDGTLVAESGEVDSQTIISVSNASVLGIHAFNYQGPSGIIVTSSANSSFYTTTRQSEGRLYWRCIPVASTTIDGSVIPNSWRTSINISWPRAVSVGEWATALPWATDLSNRNSFRYQQPNAQWIWTSDYGDVSGYDGQTNVFCSIEFPAECGGSQSIVDSECEAGATSVIIGNSEYCVKYVAPPTLPGLTWVQADTLARGDGTELLDPFNSDLHDAAREQMLENGAENAWVGGQGQYHPPNDGWVFGEACCGLDPLGGQFSQNPYNLYKQGCFRGASLTQTSQSSVDMTVNQCVNVQCVNFNYAGLLDGDTCICSNDIEEFGTAVRRDDCNTGCAGDGGSDCGGFQRYSVYAVNGVDTLNWLSGQLDNHDEVDFCGALRFRTSNGILQSGKLTDEKCRDTFRYLCELPYSSVCTTGDRYFAVTDEQYQRCFRLSDNELSWFQAQMQCRNMGGDLASLFTSNVANAVGDWLHDYVDSNLGVSDIRVWLHVSRKTWFWDLVDYTPLTYTNWGDGEPNTRDGDINQQEWECMYISQTSGYRWTAGPCDDENSANLFGYITVTELEKPTAFPPTTDSGDGASNAAAAESKGKSSSGLSTFEIVLIVVLILIILILLILIIAFCCYKKYNGGTIIGPSKYDARPIAPVPATGYLGEDDSVYTVSDTGSASDLLAHPGMFGYGGNTGSKSARSTRSAGYKQPRINLNDD